MSCNLKTLFREDWFQVRHIRVKGKFLALRGIIVPTYSSQQGFTGHLNVYLLNGDRTTISIQQIHSIKPIRNLPKHDKKYIDFRLPTLELAYKIQRDYLPIKSGGSGRFEEKKVEPVELNKETDQVLFYIGYHVINRIKLD